MAYPWSIVIIAGGESRRMGENKALKLFNGQPLVARMVQRLRPLAQELLIATNTPEKFSGFGVAVAPDFRPGFGALSGLHAALSAARQPLVAVLGCDMPFIDGDLLAAERDLLEAENADVVLPCTPDGLEPLHAVYRRIPCMVAVEAAMTENQRRLVGWLPRVKVREMPAVEVARFDPQFRSFFNVNTPEEFRRAELLDAEP